MSLNKKIKVCIVKVIKFRLDLLPSKLYCLQISCCHNNYVHITTVKLKFIQF